MPVSITAILMFSPRRPRFCHTLGALISGTPFVLVGRMSCSGRTATTPGSVASWAALSRAIRTLMPLYDDWYVATTVPPSASMLLLSAFCGLLSAALAASFSAFESFRPAVSCWTATGSPLSCTTTLTACLLRPTGVEAGVNSTEPSDTASGRTALVLVAVSAPSTIATAANVRVGLNRMNSLSIESMLPATTLWAVFPKIGISKRSKWRIEAGAISVRRADATARRHPQRKRACIVQLLSPRSCSKPIRLRCCAAPFAAVMPIPILVLIPEKAPLRETTRIGPVTISDVHRSTRDAIVAMFAAVSRLGPDGPDVRNASLAGSSCIFLSVRKSRSLPQRQWRVNANVDAFDGEVLRYRKRW